MNVIFRFWVRLVLAGILLTGGAHARETENGWLYAANIMLAGEHKYKACFLTGEVYAQAQADLADLRIKDGQGQFVPFYIRRGNSVILPGNGKNDFLRTASLSFAKKTEDNITDLTLHNSQRLRIKRIFVMANGNYQRNYEVLLGGKPVAPGKHQELANLVLEKTNISANIIDLTARPTTDPAPVIRIYNRDDRPLTITDMQVEYYVDKIVFADEGKGPYQLLWGNGKAQKPHYELELYSKYIENEEQDTVMLGKVETTAGSPGQQALPWKIILNLTMALVACILGYLIMKRMSDKR